MNIKEVLEKTRVVPVAVFDHPDDSLRIAELLLEKSLNILEITIRTESAYRCIEAVAKKFPEIFTGAGSILTTDSLKNVNNCGASFAMSPSLDMELLDYSMELQFPFVPGISTPSELGSALKKTDIIKVFPASNLGGVKYIGAMTAPFVLKNFHLVPTGGINLDNYREYLELDKVIACGMSYITDKSLIKRGDFDALSKRMDAIISGINN